jgi:ferredoxin-NADP reductase/Na+-translocating ferredoxin:NAD+ oxidoreductase RnfD subunit
MYNVVLNVLRVWIAAATILSFFGVLDYVWWHILADMMLFIGFCWGINALFGKVFKVKTNYESQFISAEILTLIVGPVHPWNSLLAIFLISLLAMASKYILAYGKRHIFNPAGVGVLASALLSGQGASWWIGGRWMLTFVAIGSFIVLQKLRWFHLFISFLVTYVATLVVTLAAQGADNSVILLSLRASILDSALVFFAAIMLVEPLTAPRGTKARMAYGAFVGVIIVLHQTYWPIEWPTYALSFETGLLVGNLATFVFSRKTERQTLKLLEKVPEAKDTYSFWFEPLRKFDFVPGQYLEWMLAHPKQDSRGARRFFTISASPTQDRLRLITRLYPNPSTFKQALMALKPGDEITVSGLEGEFTMPKEQNKKLVFIAGGVGIAPFLSVFKYLSDRNERRDIVLMYANKTKDDIAFASEIKAAAGVGVRSIDVITEPPAGWTGRSGFITQDMIKQDVPDWKERTFYVSGPEPMVLNYEKMLKQMGLPSSQVIRDYFPGYTA